MNRISTVIFRFCKPIFFSCFSHVVDQVRLDLHNGVIFPVYVSAGRNMLTVNHLINAHLRINASYPINAPPPPPRCKLCIRHSSLINAPCLIHTHSRIASKTKEMLCRERSRNLFSFFLAWLTMTCELHPVQSPQLLGNCTHSQSRPVGSGPDIDIEL